MRRSVSLLALLVALQGCASATTYSAPQMALPAAYPHQSGATPVALQGEWWRGFNDPRLNRLVTDVLARNNNLAAATIAVRRAQLQARLAANSLLPQPSGGMNASTNTDGAENYGVSASAAWEIDLFNRLGAQRDAAVWEAQATQQDRDATALSLTTTTVDLYWQLAYLNQRIAIAETNLAYARQVQTLVRNQYDAGAVSGIELAETEQSVRSQESALSALTQTRVETRNALAILFGESVWPTGDEPQALPVADAPPVPEGLPADLLGRRPDLRAAEFRLRSSLSSVDATRASMYPALSLTGSLGSASTSLGSVLANPLAALGAGITLPFLNFPRVQLNIRVSEADYEIAVANFRQTLLTAFTEVDNALSARTQLAAQGVALDQSLAAARRAEELYEVRYRAGAVALRIWLDAQNARRSAEQAAIENRLQRLNNQTTVYRVLGGDAATTAVAP